MSSVKWRLFCLGPNVLRFSLLIFHSLIVQLIFKVNYVNQTLNHYTGWLMRNSSQSVMNDFCVRLNSSLIDTGVECGGIYKNGKSY